MILKSVIADNINSCGTLSTTGQTYYLTQDISINNATCLTINANNIIIDCQGHSISGNRLIDTYGINNPEFNNIEVRNCVIKDFFYGIYFSGNYSKIINNSVSSNSDTGILLYPVFNNSIINNTVNLNDVYGIWLDESSNNNLTGNIVNSNGNMGIVLQENSNNNLVYDNFFNNTINAADDGYNSWNILDPSLVGSWHFDDIYGNTTWDFSGNNNHGTLYNFADNTNCSSASENSAISVSCPSGSVISSIINSVYVDGRSSASCSNPDPDGYGYRYCNYADNCVGQNSCSFLVSNTNCGGDPSLGYVKRLILEVACNNSLGVEGKFRKAIKFDGVDDYVNVGSNPSLKMTGQVTIEAWVKIASFPFPTNYHNVLSDHSLSSNNGKILRFSNNDIQFLLGSAGTETVNFTFNSSAAGNWQHLAATYDGSMMKLYVNGVLVDSKSRTGSIAANPNPIWIGKSGWGEYFNGTIDEVRIYNRALTQDEILSDFQHGAIKKLGTNIIGGPYLGGNFWHDYNGSDIDGDGIGDTDLPYASRGSSEHIEEGGDPLTYVPIRILTSTRDNIIKITYIPDGKENCTKIVFIQVFDAYVGTTDGQKIYINASTLSPDYGYLDDSTVLSGGIPYVVDRLLGYECPYYGINDDGTATKHAKPGKAVPGSPFVAATMSDDPYNNCRQYLNRTVAGGKLKNVTMEFETCAFCAEGKDAGHYYICMFWLWSKSGPDDGTSTALGSSPEPSLDFLLAKVMWAAKHNFKVP